MASIYTACSNCGQINRVPVEKAAAQTPVCGKCKKELSVHGYISEVNATALKNLVDKSPLPVLVDFWAPWCGPCRAFAPTFEAAASKWSDRIVFAKLNTEAFPLAGDLYHIQSIPTLAVFRRGLELSRTSGALPLPALENWIQSAMSSS